VPRRLELGSARLHGVSVSLFSGSFFISQASSSAPHGAFMAAPRARDHGGASPAVGSEAGAPDQAADEQAAVEEAAAEEVSQCKDVDGDAVDSKTAEVEAIGGGGSSGTLPETRYKTRNTAKYILQVCRRRHQQPLVGDGHSCGRCPKRPHGCHTLLA